MIGIVIVTFNSQNVISKTLDSCLLQGCEVVVVDNNSIDKTVEVIESNYPDVFIIKNEKNIGIAAALNQGFEYYMNRNEKWVLTLDHDSILPNNYINYFLDEILPKRKEDEVSFFPRTIDIKTNEIINNSRNEYYYCITSGNIVLIDAWKEVNGFDEDLFIDSVDFDFCLKLKKNNYFISEISECVMYHSIGDECKQLKFGKKNISIAFHSNFRKYFISRNVIILFKRYWKVFPKIVNKQMCFLFLEIFISIIYEKNKGKLKSYLSGIIDGIRYKTMR